MLFDTVNNVEKLLFFYIDEDEDEDEENAEHSYRINIEMVLLHQNENSFTFSVSIQFISHFYIQFFYRIYAIVNTLFTLRRDNMLLGKKSIDKRMK